MTKSMCSRDGSNLMPHVARLAKRAAFFSHPIDMLEHVHEPIATVFWIWHLANIFWASVRCLTTVMELTLEFLKQSILLDNIIRIKVYG